ncbi:MAG: hypothetical protein ACRDKT_09365 [Actinomycetota bacterium]
MTTRRIFHPARVATVAVAFLFSMLFMASPALAQVGDLGDAVTDTVNESAGGATDTVNETVGGATDTVNETVGGATDTVDETVGGATDTVDETVGGATDTVTEAVGGGSGGNENAGGSGPAGSKETTTSNGGHGSGSVGNGGSNSGSDDGTAVPPDATVIKLPNGSTVVVPGSSRGSTEGRELFGSDLPREVLAALNGMTDGFASAGAATPVATGELSLPEAPTFLENASRLAADAAKKVAFPMALLMIVIGFLMVHGKIGRKDPKLTQARLDANEDVLTFR